jgi:hypothetical protein
LGDLPASPVFSELKGKKPAMMSTLLQREMETQWTLDVAFDTVSFYFHHVFLHYIFVYFVLSMFNTFDLSM